MIGLLAGLLLVQAPPYEQSCSAGVWESWSQTLDITGQMQGNHDRSNRYCFFEGRAELAEYRSLGPDNQPVFRGVSITIWDEARETGRTLWAMVAADGYTDITQHWEDGQLVTTGHGYDPSGAFLERARYRYLPSGDFRFEMDRSFDDGENWIVPTNIIQALKTDTSPPELNNSWHPQLASLAPDFAPEGGTIILDGFAWFDWTLDDNGQPMGARFAAPALLDNGWVWRTLYWDDGGVNAIDQPLQ